MGYTANNSAHVTVTNCTFTGNTASNTVDVTKAVGGAIGVCSYTANSTATATINYCTFVSNTATTGGNIFANGTNANDATANVANSIIFGTVSGVNPTNSITNLTSAPTSTTAQTNGITHTVFRKYSELSAAVDAGQDAAVTVDQLNNAVVGTAHDIGAVEIDIPTLSVNFTNAPATLTVKQGEVNTATFAASGTATYGDNSTENLAATLTTSGTWPDWITFDANTGVVTASPTTAIAAGDYSVTLQADASMGNGNLNAAPATTNLTVTVTAADQEEQNNNNGNSGQQQQQNNNNNNGGQQENNNNNNGNGGGGQQQQPQNNNDDDEEQSYNSNSGSNSTSPTTQSQKGMFTTPSENLVELIANNFRTLLSGLPNGVKFFSNLDNVTILRFDLRAFIISIEAKLNGTLLSIVAQLSPIQVSVPGVYLMKVTVTNDQRDSMEGGRNLAYHVGPYYDFVSEDQNLASIADNNTGGLLEASDGSNGVLVDENGAVLSGDYAGQDFNILVYLAQANVPYVQFLTMEADAGQSEDIADTDTKNNGGGGCNDVIAGSLRLRPFYP